MTRNAPHSWQIVHGTHGRESSLRCEFEQGGAEHPLLLPILSNTFLISTPPFVNGFAQRRFARLPGFAPSKPFNPVRCSAVCVQVQSNSTCSGCAALCSESGLGLLAQFAMCSFDAPGSDAQVSLEQRKSTLRIEQCEKLEYSGLPQAPNYTM